MDQAQPAVDGFGEDQRSLRRDARRVAIIGTVLVVAVVATTVIWWARYVANADRPPYWGAVAGHLTFWIVLILASVLLPTVAYLKGHQRFRWVGRYGIYLGVSLLVGLIADQLLLDDFSPTKDAPWLLAFSLPFVIWVWSVLMAPVVLPGVCIWAAIRAAGPAKQGSWWQVSYQPEQ